MARSKCSWMVFFFVLTLPAAVPGVTSAQNVEAPTGGSTAETPPTKPDECSEAVFPDQLMVLSVEREGGGPTYQDLPLVELDDYLILTVNDLSGLRHYMMCEERAGRKRSLVLYLNDRPLETLEEYPPSRPQVDKLRFPLERREASRAVWTEILGKPTLTPREVEVSMGFADGYAFQTDAKIQLKILGTLGFGFWVTLFGLGLGVFFYAARRSNILRNPAEATQDAPYSLSRFQAAVWFFLVLGAYLLIGLVTGDYTTSITATAVALLGISGATTVASNLVAHNRAHGDDSLLATIKPQGQDKFWLGIVSDSQGVSFHRFQIVVWTVVFGIVFVWRVYENLAMPHFDETILGLMGVSSGTYLGLKTTETRKPVASATSTETPASP